MIRAYEQNCYSVYILRETKYCVTQITSGNYSSMCMYKFFLSMKVIYAFLKLTKFRNKVLAKPVSFLGIQL